MKFFKQTKETKRKISFFMALAMIISLLPVSPAVQAATKIGTETRPNVKVYVTTDSACQKYLEVEKISTGGAVKVTNSEAEEALSGTEGDVTVIEGSATTASVIVKPISDVTFTGVTTESAFKSNSFAPVTAGGVTTLGSINITKGKVTTEAVIVVRDKGTNDINAETSTSCAISSSSITDKSNGVDVIAKVAIVKDDDKARVDIQAVAANHNIEVAIQIGDSEEKVNEEKFDVTINSTVTPGVILALSSNDATVKPVTGSTFKVPSGKTVILSVSPAAAYKWANGTDALPTLEVTDETTPKFEQVGETATYKYELAITKNVTINVRDGKVVEDSTVTEEKFNVTINSAVSPGVILALSSNDTGVTPVTGSAFKVTNGKTVTLSVSPADGYKWANGTGALPTLEVTGKTGAEFEQKGTTDTYEYVLNVTGDVTITVKDGKVVEIPENERNFNVIINSAVTPGVILALSSTDTGVTPVTGSAFKVTNGKTVTLSVSPADGYKWADGTDALPTLEGVTGAKFTQKGETTTYEYVLNVTKDVEITVKDGKVVEIPENERKFNVTINSAVTPGVILALSSTDTDTKPVTGSAFKVTNGKNVTLSVSPADGYKWADGTDALPTLEGVTGAKFTQKGTTDTYEYVLNVTGDVTINVKDGKVVEIPENERKFNVTINSAVTPGVILALDSNDTDAKPVTGSAFRVTNGKNVTLSVSPADGYKWDDGTGALPTLEVTGVSGAKFEQKGTTDTYEYEFAVTGDVTITVKDGKVVEIPENERKFNVTVNDAVTSGVILALSSDDTDAKPVTGSAFKVTNGKNVTLSVSPADGYKWDGTNPQPTLEGVTGAEFTKVGTTTTYEYVLNVTKGVEVTVKDGKVVKVPDGGDDEEDTFNVTVKAGSDGADKFNYDDINLTIKKNNTDDIATGEAITVKKGDKINITVEVKNGKVLDTPPTAKVTGADKDITIGEKDAAKGTAEIVVDKDMTITISGGTVKAKSSSGSDTKPSYIPSFSVPVTVPSTPAPSATPSTEPSVSPSAEPSATTSAAPGAASSAVPGDTGTSGSGSDSTGGSGDSTPGASSAPVPSTAPGGKDDDKTTGGTTTSVKVGKKATISGSQYKVTSVKSGSREVQFTKGKKNTSKVVIPATVKIGGKKYKVTSIAKNAFKGNKKLKKVTISANVSKIGKAAFKGCKKLKKIVIKSKKLTLKKVGANAFKGINKKATIKVPKKKVKAYKKIIKAKGAAKTVKVKK